MPQVVSSKGPLLPINHHDLDFTLAAVLRGRHAERRRSIDLGGEMKAPITMTSFIPSVGVANGGGSIGHIERRKIHG